MSNEDFPIHLTKPALGNQPAGFALANDAAEEAALEKQGYVSPRVKKTVPEITNTPPVDPKEAEAARKQKESDREQPSNANDPTREDMLANAEKRGIKVDKRWSNERIAEELAKA